MTDKKNHSFLCGETADAFKARLGVILYEIKNEIEKKLLKQYSISISASGSACFEIEKENPHYKYSQINIEIICSSKVRSCFSPEGNLIKISENGALLTNSLLKELLCQEIGKALASFLALDTSEGHKEIFRVLGFSKVMPRDSEGKEGSSKDLVEIQSLNSKINKLLALAHNNPNAHESLAAFSKAQQLIRKYNIENSSLNNSSTVQTYRQVVFESRIKDDPKRDFIFHVASALFPNVPILYTSSFQNDWHYLEMAGPIKILEIAEIILSSVSHQADCLFQDYSKNEKRRIPKKEINSFFEGLSKRFQQSADSAINTGPGLITVSEAKRHEEIAFGKTRSRYRKAQELDVASYEKGSKASLKISINSPLNKRGEVLLIE